jgi:hypothetical protein
MIQGLVPERRWSELTGVTKLKMLVPESLTQRPSLGDVFVGLFSGSWESRDGTRSYPTLLLAALCVGVAYSFH